MLTTVLFYLHVDGADVSRQGAFLGESLTAMFAAMLYFPFVQSSDVLGQIVLAGIVFIAIFTTL